MEEEMIASVLQKTEMPVLQFSTALWSVQQNMDQLPMYLLRL